MNKKHFVVLLVLLSLLLTSALPVVLAQEAIDVVSFTDDYLQNRLPQGWGVLSAEDLFAETLEADLFLLDVRQPEEWDETGYIPGAVNVPVREIATKLDLLPTDLDAPIVVYCKSGWRGEIGMVALQMLGYTNVRNLAGGIMGWIGADFEVATDPVEFVAGDMPDIDPDLVAQMDTFLQEEVPQGWGVLSVEDLFTETLEADLFLLDVRQPEEWDELGYIPGAVNVPLREVAANVDVLPEDKDAAIVVYCKSGWRGTIGMVALQFMGYTNVRNLAGGIVGWIGAEYPVEGAPAAAADEFDAVALTDAYLKDGLPEGYGVLKVEDLFAETLEAAPFLLDVRQPEELEELGYIEGAVNVPVREIAANLAMLPADLDEPIVVYCKSGWRGEIGMVALQMMGYTNVRNLAGGILGWIGADYPVVMDPIEAVAGEMPPVDAAVVAAMDDFLMNAVPQGWGVLQVEDLATEMLESDIFLVDVRQPEEWDETGYISGAINVPLRELAASIDQLPADKDTDIVVYCKSGWRGTIGMAALQFMGYTNVRNLAGGILGWIGADYEVEGAPAAVEVEIVLPEGEALSAEALQPMALETVQMVAEKDGFGTITNDGLRAVMGDVFLLDVREDSEWAEGFIEGAVHVPLREVAANLQVLPEDKSAPIVVYCAAGQRGAIAQYALSLLGYEDVMNLRGGAKGWDGEFATDEIAPMVHAFPEVDADVWTTVNAYLSGLEGFGTISGADFDAMLLEGATPTIIDVRETSEYEAGHIANAVNLPTRTFAAAELPAMDGDVIVYGSSGPRGATVMTALQMLGVNALNLGGGSTGWESAGYELVTD